MISSPGNNDALLKLSSVHYNPAVASVHMMLKREKIMGKEGLVNKTHPRKDWASSTHTDKLKKKM